MRPLYTKFSLVFLFFLLLHANTPSAMMFSFDKELLPTKDKTKETTNPIKSRSEIGGRIDRPKKDENFSIPNKAKRKVLPIPTTTLTEVARISSITPSPLTSKGIQPIAPTPDKVVGPDPFFFTITSNKDSIDVGEELELTVRVNWVDFGVNNGVRFLPEWYKYTLKVVMPKGFTQTGGDYTDYCTKPVDALNPLETFTIKGKFEHESEDAKFTVLRGFEGADDKSSFIWKGEMKIVFINTPNNTRLTQQPILDARNRQSKVTYNNTIPSPYKGLGLMENLCENCSITNTNSSINAQSVRATMTNNNPLTGIPTVISPAVRFISNEYRWGCIPNIGLTKWFYFVPRINADIAIDIGVSGGFLDYITFGPFESLADAKDSTKYNSDNFSTCNSRECGGDNLCNYQSGIVTSRRIMFRNAQIGKIYTICVSYYTPGSSFSIVPDKRIEICTEGINITSNKNCLDASTKLTATYPGCAKSEIKWYKDGGLVTSQNGKDTYDIDSKGKYYANCKLDCNKSNEINISSDCPPVPPTCTATKPTFTGDASGCDIVTLTRSADEDQHTYQWYKDGLPESGKTGITYNATTSGTHSYTVKAKKSLCTDTDSNPKDVTITTKSTETPAAITGNVATTCAAAITLTTGGCSSGTYYWKNSTTDMSSVTNTLVLNTGADTKDTYTVYCGTKGCHDSAKGRSEAVDVNTISTPELEAKDNKVNIWTQGGTNTVTLRAKGCTYGDLKWYKNGSEIALTTVADGVWKTVSYNTRDDAGGYNVSCGCDDLKSNGVTLIYSDKCGTLTGPTFKKGGVVVSQVIGYAGTTVEITATCDNGGGPPIWTSSAKPGTNPATGGFILTFPNSYRAKCSTTECELENPLEAKSSNCDASEPTFGYSPSQSVSSGTNVVITGGCTVGIFTWNDGSANPRTVKATPTYRSFGAKCTVSSGCSNSGSADINVGCDATTPNFTSSPNSFPVAEGVNVWVKGTCGAGQTFHWSNGAAGDEYYITSIADNTTLGGYCTSNTVSNCRADGSYDITVTKRTALTLSLNKDNAICTNGTCDGKIFATIGNRANKFKFAYWLYKQDAAGNWVAQSFRNPAGNMVTSQGDWSETLTLALLPFGKYRVDVRDYSYPNNDSRDGASDFIEIEKVVCPTDGNFNAQADKYCIDPTNPSDFVKLQHNGCATGTIKWWRDDTSLSGGWLPAYPAFDPSNVKVAGRYKAICETTQCPSTRNDKAFSNGVEIINPQVNSPIIVAANNKTYRNTDGSLNTEGYAPSLTREVCTTNSSYTSRSCNTVSIYAPVDANGIYQPISSIYQLMGNGVAYFQTNSGVKVPSTSVLKYKLGETVTLQASGCSSGMMTWSNGKFGNSISFQPTQDNMPMAAYCDGGINCRSKISNVIILQKTSGEFTATSNATALCASQPSVTLSSKGCDLSSLTVKWYQKINETSPEVEIGTGVNLTYTPLSIFKTDYYAKCFDGGTLLLTSKKITVSNGDNLKADILLRDFKEIYNPSSTDPVIKAQPTNLSLCVNEELNLTVKGCEGKVRWANLKGNTGSGYQVVGGRATYVTSSTQEYVDIVGKSGSSSFTKSVTAAEDIYYNCTGFNPITNDYLCASPWKKVVISIKNKSNAKPNLPTGQTAYTVCENLPLSLGVTNKEGTDTKYIWKRKFGSTDFVEYDYRPRTVYNDAGVPTVYGITDPLDFTNAGSDLSASWKLDVVNDCGVATNDFDVKVTNVKSKALFTYSGSYKNMTFKNNSDVVFVDYKALQAYYTNPTTGGTTTPTGPAPNSERKDTRATWTFKKDRVTIYTFVQNRLKADTDWVPFNYTFPSEGQYEVSVEITDFLTSCPATITQLIDAKCDPPTKPVKPANQDKFVCLGSTTTPTASFNATGCIPDATNGLDLKWYKVDPSDPAANTTPLVTGANYTITPSTGTLAVNVPNFTNGVYAFRAKCHFGTCASDFSDTYKLTIDKAATVFAKAIDPVTSVPDNTLVTAIENRSVTLSTTGCEYGTVTWYKADNSILRTGNPIALTKSDVGNVTGTAFGFYAKCTTGQTPNTCTSANSNTVSVKFTACPTFINLPLTTYSGCESVTINVPVGSGDGIYKWYQNSSAYVKGSGNSITLYESGTYSYASCGTFNPWITVNITKLRPRIDSGPLVISNNSNPLDAQNYLRVIDDAAVSGDPASTYTWKRLAETGRPEITLSGNPNTFNPATFTGTPGIGKYELVVAKGSCTSPVLKTEVYPNNCAVTFTTAINCDPLAKITVTITAPATGTKEYRLDVGDWQTTNIFTDITYGKHTLSVRVTNGSTVCYGTKVFAETDFDACGKLNCDGIVIVAKDNANNETNTIPRGANKTLQTLNLSAASLDGADLSKGVTYLWERMQVNTTGGQFTAFSSTQAAVSIGVPGRYTLKMVRGTTTCTTEIAINAKPCTETPDPTGAVVCTTPALTAVADEAANRLTNLAPGDVVRCGDFNITVTEATGNANGWSGKGYVKVPYLNAEVSIILRNAVFNDCYQLTNANATAELPTVYTEYDPKWGSITDVDNVLANFKSSLQGVIDIMNNFSGKCEDVRALDKAVKEYEQGFSQPNSTYTEAERTAMLAKITNLKTKRDQLVSCSSCSVSSGRIAAANDATVDCGPKAIECRDELKGMLGDAKEVFVFDQLLGEFVDYQAYQLALGNKAIPVANWTGQDGHWLKSDRESCSTRWDNACWVIVKNNLLNKFRPFREIKDFYKWVRRQIEIQGHDVKWAQGADLLVTKLAYFDAGIEYYDKKLVNLGDLMQIFLSKSYLGLLSELNLGIANYSVKKWNDLLIVKGLTNPVKGRKAYDWDKAFIYEEQGVIAPPIYSKYEINYPTAIRVMNQIVRHEVSDNPIDSIINLFIATLSGIPAFDSSVDCTDSQYRIDFPLKMLYPRTHVCTHPVLAHRAYKDFINVPVLPITFCR